MQNNLLKEEGDFQISAMIEKYTSKWRWFLFSVFVSLFLAIFFLKITVPQYQTSSEILIKEDNKSGVLAELSDLSNFGFGGTKKNNIDNEIEIVKSRTLIENNVKELGLNLSVYVENKFNDREVFDESPITVDFLNKNNNYFKSEAEFSFLYTGGNSFTLLETVKEGIGAKSILKSVKDKYFFGESIATTCGDFVIKKSTNFNVKNNICSKDSKFIIKLSKIEDVANSFRDRLKVAPLSKQSSVLQLSIIDNNIKRSEDFLNNLIRIYNNNAIENKNLISVFTSKFIKNRLSLIMDELGDVEHEGEDFKSDNKLTDIESEAKIFIEGSNLYNVKGVETDIQLNIVNSMLDFLKKNSKYELLPSNLIKEDSQSGSQIGEYNKLILERNRLLKSATLENPSIILLDQQLSSMRSNVITSLERLKNNISLEKKNLSFQENIIDSKIKKIPSQERQFRDIARQQKVKEELYIYLLKKQEETAISLATTEPIARVIDPAKAQSNPVSPKKMLVLFAALILGLIIPFGILYILDLLDTKVKKRSDVENLVSVPIIGDLPTSESSFEMIKSDSRSSAAEAMRIIRTNLEFMISKSKEGMAKTIFLTSTFPKEGKTFVSVNLAAAFALSGKKVLLIGMDVRNPKLDEYMILPSKGITNYLSNNDIDVNSLLVKQENYENFYVLPAGVIPPNPAELLMSDGVSEVFATLKTQFDYIIVDTAPVSLVADTLLISKYADCFVYVVRANVLEKKYLSIPEKLYVEKKLPNMSILLNDSEATNGYGYGYGYTESSKKVKWFNKFKK